MRFDLGGVGIPVQPKAGDEFIGDLLPVQIGIGDQMGVVVSRCAVNFPQQGEHDNLLALAAQAECAVGHLLAQRGRGGRLAMGARQHGLVGAAVGKVGNGVDNLIHHGQQHLTACFAQHQTVGEVVDVFGGAGEMDEFTDRFQLAVAGNLLLEKILHRLHVMVGGALDVLYPVGVVVVEIIDDSIEDMGRMFTQFGNFGDAGMGGKHLQPADFHQHTMADEAKFAE